MFSNFTWSEFWKHDWICRTARHKQVETYDCFLIFAITGCTPLLHKFSINTRFALQRRMFNALIEQCFQISPGVNSGNTAGFAGQHGINRLKLMIVFLFLQ
jgi:hypothetical protein